VLKNAEAFLNKQTAISNHLYNVYYIINKDKEYFCSRPETLYQLYFSKSYRNRF